MAGILLIAETTDEGDVAPISYELLGAAKKLSDEGGGDITAFIAGSDEHAQDLAAHGAGTVFRGTSDALSPYTSGAWLTAIAEAINESGADIILLGQTSLGRDLAPALAFKLESACATDCVDLAIEDGRLRATRTCYGGNARAEHKWSEDVQIVTVKPKNFDPAESSGGSGEVKTIDTAGEAKVKVINREKAEVEGIRLEDAQIVVSGGRGLGDPSGFEMLEELGKLLGGAVGASRAACDLGWYPPAQQVGLTGKTVSPNLYIAVAISGASQHMAGMAGSKNILAINKDPDCNMVQVADWAIIDDYKKVVPALIEALKAAK